MGWSRREWIAVLAVGLLPFLYFYPATFGQIVLAPDDGATFFFPLRTAAAEIALNGEFPLWNPYIFGGMPLFGSIQGGILFPPNWSFLILTPHAAMNFSVLLTYVIAGLGAYWYARRIGSSVAGAFLTAFTWQFCGFMIAPMGHIASIQAASVLPWIFWAVESYAQTQRKAYGLLVAAFVTLQIFAGHPQTFVYSMFIVVAYVGVKAFLVNRSYLYSGAMLVAGTLVGAIQLIPTWELSNFSMRQTISYDFFSAFSMPPSFIRNFVAPYISGGSDGRLFELVYTGADYYGEYIGYVGLGTLMLALAAPFLRRDIDTVFWSLVAIMCLVLALGPSLPFDLYRLVFYLPGLNLYRAPSRHLMEVDLALAILAGRSLTFLGSSLEKQDIRKFLILGILVSLLTLLVVITAAGGKTWLIPELILPVIVSLTSLAAIWMMAKEFRGSTAFLIIIFALDLALWGQFTGWRTNSPKGISAYTETPAVAFLKQKQREDGLARVLTLTAPSDLGDATALMPNTYMLNGIQNAAGYDALGLQRFSTFTDGMKEWGELVRPVESLTNDRSLDLMNVRYLIASRTMDGMIRTGKHVFDERSLAERWQKIASFDGIAIYENLQVLPRVWLSTSALVIEDEADILKAVRSGHLSDGQVWDAAQTVMLEHASPIALTGENGAKRVKTTNYSANHIRISTGSTVPTILVLAENNYPGWVARVDGNEQPILGVNYNLRGLALPPGEHVVSFDYRPRSFLVGLIVSALSTIFLIFWASFRGTARTGQR